MAQILLSSWKTTEKLLVHVMVILIASTVRFQPDSFFQYRTGISGFLSSGHLGYSAILLSLNYSHYKTIVTMHSTHQKKKKKEKKTVRLSVSREAVVYQD